MEQETAAEEDDSGDSGSTSEECSEHSEDSEEEKEQQEQQGDSTKESQGEDDGEGGESGADELREKLTQFYQQHEPSRLPHVDTIAAKYRDNPAALWKKLHAIYPPAAADGGDEGAVSAAEVRSSLWSSTVRICRRLPNARRKTPVSPLLHVPS